MSRFDRFVEDPAATAEPPQQASAPSANRFDQFVANPANVPQPKQRQPNEPFGELRPAEYSWRETLGNKAQDALIALGAKPYVAGRVGRGVVDVATMIPPVGAALAGADAAYYSSKGQPLRAGVEAIGVLPGATMARRMVHGQPRRAIAPTEAELDATRHAQYRAWRNSPVVRDPGMMDDLTNSIAQALTQRGSNQVKAPTAWQALEEGRKLKKQTGMTNEDFETLRQQFDVKNFDKPDDIIGAARARHEFDRYMTNPPAQFVRQGSPQQLAVDHANLLNARGNTAALKRSQVLSDASTVAELKAETGRDFGKTLTGKIDALATTKGGERSTRGFTDAEQQMARNAITDSLTRRMQSTGQALQRASGARSITDLAVAPSATGGAGWALGLDPFSSAAVGTAAQAATNLTGRALQSAAGRRIGEGVETAAANLRMRSPLAQQDPSFGFITDPDVMAKDAAKYLMYPWARGEAADAVEYDRTPHQYR